MCTQKLTINQNHQIILSSKHYEVLECTSENNELVPENIQETDTVRLTGNVTHRNWNALISQNTGSKRPTVVINKPSLTRFLLS